MEDLVVTASVSDVNKTKLLRPRQDQDENNKTKTAAYKTKTKIRNQDHRK